MSLMPNSTELPNATQKKNFKSFLSNYSSYEPLLLQSYFEHLFKTYSSNPISIPFIGFYKFLSWSFFLGEKLYEYLRHIDKLEEIKANNSLSKEAFAGGLAKLYGNDSIEAKAEALFAFLDFNHDAVIQKKDMIIVLSQFMAMSEIANAADDVFPFVNAFFTSEDNGLSSSMTLEQYKERIRQHNADVIYLMLLFIYKNKPFNDKSIEYYSQLMNSDCDGNDKQSASKMKTSWNSNGLELVFPSDTFFIFLETHMNMHYCLNNDEEDLNELENFEDSLTSIISALRDIKMISNQDCRNDDDDDGICKHKKSISGLINIKPSVFFSHSNTGNILRVNSDNPNAKGQRKSEELTSKSLFNKAIEDNRPYILTCFEVNNKRVMIKRKLALVANDIFLYKYDEKGNVKLTRIFPLKDLYLQSTSTSTSTLTSASTQSSLSSMALKAHRHSKGKEEEIELQDKASLTFIFTHQNKLLFKQLYFRTESKCIKLKQKIESITPNRNISDEYTILKSIGKGTFGEVFKAEQKQTKQLVAIKIMDKPYANNDLSLLDIIYRERDISLLFKAFPHKGIIQIKDLIETLNHVIVVQEYIPTGNLKQYMNHSQLSIEESYEVMKQLIHSMQFLFDFGIIHRDIKKDNVLIFHTRSGCIQTKLIDFSFSIVLGTKEKISGMCGTPIYLSPEMIANRPYSFSVDIWALGIIGFSLITGIYPFDSEDFYQLTNQILFKDVPVSVLLDCLNKSTFKAKETLVKIVNGCLQKEKSMRMKIQDLIQLVSNCK